MDISSMLEVQVKEETDVKENVTPGKDQPSSATGTTAASISQEESNYYKLVFGNDIAAVRFRRLHCTACDTHIGSAPAQSHNMFEHPILRTLLCSRCREFYGDGTFEQGDDATDMFCRWCANGGNLYCCSYCSNTFCSKCIRRNFTLLMKRKIEADEKWKCFVCNPSELYSARAVCWALLQHIQTVKRILAQNKEMSAEELEEKMNLDESPCCPRRIKYKRRRLGSNSEEEDDPYSSKANGVPTYVKRKPLKRYKPTNRSTYTTNGIRETQPYRSPIPIRPRPAFLNDGQTFNAEPSKSVSHEKSVNPEIVVPSPNVIKSNTSLSSRFDPNTLQQQPTLYHTSFMNTSGSTAYIQTPVNSTTRIILPPQTQSQLTSYRTQQGSSYQPQQASSYQSQQANLYQPQQASSYQPQQACSYQARQASSYQPQQACSYQPRQASSYQPRQASSYQPRQASSYQSSQSFQSSPNTMVSIPNSIDKHRSLFLVPKSKEVDITLSPNVIELDSDSDDELTIVSQQKNSMTDGGNMDINVSSNKVVPVALTWENNNDVMREEQPLIEIRAIVEKDVSFGETMLPHGRELDKLLSDTKEKMYNLFNLNNAVENIEVETQQKMKHFYCNIRNAIVQLVHINDRVVRQYVEWKRSRKMEASPSTNENTLGSEKDIDIPLDMICINDSDTESECEDRIMKPSDLVKDSNIIKDLLFCKTDVVHRGVGDDSVHLSTKAIQVYNTMDYEKSIGCSVFTKTDQDPKTDDSVSNLPAVSGKNFSTFEEQFLFYLQQIKDNGIEKENTKAADSGETSLQEVVQTNPLFISHFQDIDLPVISTDRTKNCQENNVSDSINLITKDDKNDTLDKNNIEIVNNSDINIQKTNLQLDDKLQSTESRNIHADTTNGEIVISNNNEANSNENDNVINMEIIAFTGSEEDCTIIDN